MSLKIYDPAAEMERMKNDPVAKKFGQLLAQLFDVFNETVPQARPDFLLWLRIEISKQVIDHNHSFISFMAEARKLREDV